MSYPQIKLITVPPSVYKENQFDKASAIIRYLLTSRHSQNDEWVSKSYQPIDGLDKNSPTRIEIINHEKGEFCLHYYSVK